MVVTRGGSTVEVIVGSKGDQEKFESGWDAIWGKKNQGDHAKQAAETEHDERRDTPM